MTKILIVYSTTDGQTKKICSRIVQSLERLDNQVQLISIEHAGETEVQAADKVVVGASIRYGKHGKLVYAFADKYQRALESKPNAFFSVNVVARKPAKATPETNPYLKKFLRRISWKPGRLAVFAGRVDYKRYNFFDRNMIRLIMWMTKGPTDPQSDTEFTDWNKVAEFAQVIHEM